MTETTKGDGWAIGSIDGMGHGPGFRKVRKELGVTAYVCVGGAGGNVGRDGVLPEGEPGAR